MTVRYNMNPFEVLNIIYRGKTDGFPDEDFELNAQKRGFYCPELLRRFLRGYGHMPVNHQSDSVRLLHPNIMYERVFRYGGNRDLPLTIIGRLGEFQVAFSDREDPDPPIFLLKTAPEQAQILPSDDTISEILKVMACGVLLKTRGAVIADEPAQAVKLLRDNRIDLEKISNNPSLQREYSICFSEFTGTFAAAEFVGGELARFFFAHSENFAVEG